MPLVMFEGANHQSLFNQNNLLYYLGFEMFSLLQGVFGKCFENVLLDSPFLLNRKHHCCASKSFKIVPHEMKEGVFVKSLERRKKVPPCLKCGRPVGLPSSLFTRKAGGGMVADAICPS